MSIKQPPVKHIISVIKGTKMSILPSLYSIFERGIERADILNENSSPTAILFIFIISEAAKKPTHIAADIKYMAAKSVI